MITEDRRNGYGLRYGHNPNGHDQVYTPWFDYSPDLAPESGDCLVLGGEPGAGKSHITEDIFQIGYGQGKEVVFLSTHINSGSRKGAEKTAEVLKAATDRGEEALLVLDNFDFLIYSGGKKKRRTQTELREYFGRMSTQILSSRDSGCSIAATVHSKEWLVNHTKWTPPELIGEFGIILTEFGGIRPFTGEISMSNATDLLVRRGISVASAEDIARNLYENNGLCFRQAHHIDPAIIEAKGVEAAMNIVDAKKQAMIDAVQ